MRERVEDLGRLYVMLKNILEIDFLDEEFPCQNQVFPDYFRGLPEEEQDEILDKYIYGKEFLQEKLYECMATASGQDTLNICSAE